MSKRGRDKIEAAALGITRWIGSPQSLIAHSIWFGGTIAILSAHLLPFDAVILVFNTAVSLEAIYLAIFIQMTVNRQSESLEEVEEDIDEMQEDVGEIQEDIDEMQKDVDELQGDVEELTVESGDETPKLVSPELADIHARLKVLLHDIERVGQMH
ncbi:MAG: DUF1003 domain-containing protein [Minisyncoccia bacterium]